MPKYIANYVGKIYATQTIIADSKEQAEEKAMEDIGEGDWAVGEDDTSWEVLNVEEI